MRADGAVVAFDDRLLGPVSGVVDDFVVRRGDGAFAYNLAVVVDDADQGVEEVVRGSDLAESTPRQLWLARALGLPEPAYAHVPLVLGPDGVAAGQAPRGRDAAGGAGRTARWRGWRGVAGVLGRGAAGVAGCVRSRSVAQR